MNLGIPRPVRRCSLVKLPGELLLLIGRQVRCTRDLQNLRLVCKLFDGIFAPVVLSHIYLGFRHQYYYYVAPPRGLSLRDLTRKNKSLAFVKLLTVYSLLSTEDTPPLSQELEEKCYLKKLQEQECFPNLESVKWIVQNKGPRTLFFKVLALLPSLKELDLYLKPYDDALNAKALDSCIDLLGQVNGLQKLTLRLRDLPWASDVEYFPCLGQVIRSNPNLAYLHLESDGNKKVSLLHIFRDALVDHPPHLKHLVLDIPLRTHEPNMIPHLRSLQSLNIYWTPAPYFWPALALNGIFIPFLTVAFVTEDLCEYLLLNASLVSFTIAAKVGYSKYHETPTLFHALKTTNIAQIVISPSNWNRWFTNVEVEACLRRCAKLRRIKLNFFENDPQPVYDNIRATTETVSRLADNISLEIFGNDAIHRAFRECCQSEDPLIESLQQRLVFLELQDLESYFPDLNPNPSLYDDD